MKLNFLIPDWRLAWRFVSIQAALLLALLSAVQAEVLPLFSPLFPPHIWPWVSGGFALLIVLLRLWVQPGLAGAREGIHNQVYNSEELSIQ